MIKIVAIIFILGVLLFGVVGCEWGKEIPDHTSSTNEPSDLTQDGTNKDESSSTEAVFPQRIPEE